MQAWPDDDHLPIADGGHVGAGDGNVDDERLALGPGQGERNAEAVEPERAPLQRHAIRQRQEVVGRRAQIQDRRAERPLDFGCQLIRRFGPECRVAG